MRYVHRINTKFEAQEKNEDDGGGMEDGGKWLGGAEYDNLHPLLV